MSSGIRTEGPFRYLSSQRPLRILDIFDQTAAEVWEREKSSSMKKERKKSWSLMIKRDMTSGILHGLPSLHPDICLGSDQSTAQVWETKIIKKKQRHRHNT